MWSQRPLSTAMGVTPSQTANLAIGGGIVGASNGLAVGVAGWDVSVLAGVLSMAFNDFKQCPWFDQHRYGRTALVVFGIVIGLLVFGFIGHRSWEEAIARGAGIGLQSWVDYLGVKASGLAPLAFPSVADPVAELSPALGPVFPAGDVAAVPGPELDSRPILKG